MRSRSDLNRSRDSQVPGPELEPKEISTMSPLRIVMMTLFAFLLLPTVSQAQPPAPRCVSPDFHFPACEGNTGYVGPGACDGVLACESNSGDISKNGCHDTQACSFN